MTNRVSPVYMQQMQGWDGKGGGTAALPELNLGESRPKGPLCRLFTTKIVSTTRPDDRVTSGYANDPTIKGGEIHLPRAAAACWKSPLWEMSVL